MTQQAVPASGPAAPVVDLSSSVVAVQIGKIAPRGGRSAKLRGKGELQVSPTGIRLTGKVSYGHPVLCALGATVATAVIVEFTAQATNFTTVPGLIVWLIIFDAIFKKPIDVLIDTDRGAAVYLPKKRVVCLQLQDATWVAVRAHKNEMGVLVDRLQGIYGSRMSAT